MKFHSQKEALRPTTIRTSSQRGIALIITLIMLSVTLVMAVAFLAVAQRERATVSIATDSVNARLATEAALAAAQSQILANVVASGNGLYNSQLMVSTNYINYLGFNPGVISPTNVNYDYLFNSSTPLSAAQFEQNIANLQYQPRAPVMISAAEPDGRFYLDLNRNGVFDPTGGGGLPNTNLLTPPLVPYVDFSGATNFGVPNPQIGDPEWIGVLERSDSPHSVDNKFVYRYAYAAVPIGNGLDLNYIHNQAFSKSVNPSVSTSVNDGFMRNQGVGSWELNLAAFLADLNTNEWNPPTVENINNNPYDYREAQNPSGFNSGVAFEDALALLSYRYNYNYGNLATADNMFFNAANIFPFDNIDEYSDGSLQITTTNINEIANEDRPNLSWPGADNPNRFYNLPSELYDPTISSPNFASHLLAVSTNLVGVNKVLTTYDRYTFYRMLGQIGTESSADDDGKLNLDYDNTDGSGNVLRGSQTNQFSWTASAFFTNAADRMLRMYTTNWFKSGPSNFLQTYYGIPNYTYFYTYTNSGGFSITVFNDPNGFGLTNVPFFGMTNQIPAFGVSHIPVFVNNAFVYSSAINRVLQLAANMYDASTNAPYTPSGIPSGFYPSVFRPRFTKDVFGNVFVTSYTNVTSVMGIGDFQLTTPIDLTAIIATPSTFSNVTENVYGVPWIIGAKKGLPNFNQFYMQNNVQITRKLQVGRTKIEAYRGGTSSTSGDFYTNEMFIMSISNNIGYSLWNSYTTNYPGTPTFYVNDILSMSLSNALRTVIASTNFLVSGSLSVGSWPGSAWDATKAPGSRQAAPNSFIFGNWSFPFMQPSVYQFDTGVFMPLTVFPTPSFNTNILNLPNLPQLAMMVTNHLQAYILDNGHVVDYVQFGGPSSSTNLNNELADVYLGTNIKPYQMWYTNASGTGTSPNGPSLGIANQIYVSRTGPSVAPTAPPSGWTAPPNLPPGLAASATSEQMAEAEFFNDFFLGVPISSGGQNYNDTNLVQQAPYTPTRTLSVLTLWQANDPLVHYLSSDLNEINNYTGLQHSDDLVNNPLPTIVQNALGQKGNVIGDDRYQPWGDISQMATLTNGDQNAYNLAYRDPLVYGSDNWDFPDNRYPSVGWLGRVHRGTPWQTVYLKATNIDAYVAPTTPTIPTGQIIWGFWSGNVNGFDAFNALPVQDNQLFDLFTTALDDNASRGTLSVNQTGLAAWSALLSGVSVISNATENPTFEFPPLQANVVIDPAGVDTNSPVWKIVNSINATRANTALFGNQAFSHIGHILQVPALTEHSPFLNNSNLVQQQFDVSDEMYERIPQQVMGLLRLGSPRYVIYCYGQALRPAQDGTALDTGNFGLVTNYQVVAESVARAVVTVHPQIVYRPPNAPTTNYTTTVESYTVLPSN